MKKNAMILVHQWNPNGTNDVEILIDGDTVEVLPEALFGLNIGNSDFKVVPLKTCLKHVAVSPVSDGRDTLELFKRYF